MAHAARPRRSARATCRDFLDEMKASGFVATVARESGQKEAMVAPIVPS